jgi:putative redox protein
MTLNGYARRKKLNVTQVSVRVEHDRIHAEDCDTCEKTEGKVDQFTRYIKIEGDITEEQHSRMMQIADLCPVHKSLENEIKIETQVEAVG